MTDLIAQKLAPIKKNLWIWIALTPVGYLVGIAIGEGIYGLLGYAAEDQSGPGWVKALASIPAAACIYFPIWKVIVLSKQAAQLAYRPARIIGPAAIIIAVFAIIPFILGAIGLA